VTRISVDEVYARSKGKEGESRDDRFLTVITDLKTHKVIWVGDSRKHEALEQFFRIIGKKACSKILVVAMDQYEAYRSAIKKYCKNAVVVWDRFHLAQSFNNALNEDRKYLHEKAAKGSREKFLARGKFRFIFLKKSSKRTREEEQHFEEVMANNDLLLNLELIKERFLTFFEAVDEIEG
jgi:transposase